MSPSSVVSSIVRGRRAAERRCRSTDCRCTELQRPSTAFVSGNSGSQLAAARGDGAAPQRDGAGSAMRPAWPTSCCSSSVAPRMPLCISVRFQIVCCDLVICISALVTMLGHDQQQRRGDDQLDEREAGIPSGCSWSPWLLELRRLQRDDRRLRDQRAGRPSRAP